MYCAASHNGPNWHPGIVAYRRGHPLEVEHHEGRVILGKGRVGVLLDRSIRVLTAWGPLSEEQTDIALEGSVSLDQALEEILSGE